MVMYSFELLQPFAEHAKVLLEWRNDPLTRQMSFNQQQRSWEEYWPFFKRQMFQHPELPALFLLRDGVRVAYLGFQPIPDPLNQRARCCDISIHVAPAFRGQGIAVQALNMSLNWLRRQGYDRVLAEIKMENTASCKAFSKAGFVFFADTVKSLPQGDCPIKQYLAELRPVFNQNGTYIIAEAGSNWRLGTAKRDREMARALIDVAVQSGANAVKFQTYRPESVYVENAGSSDYLEASGIRESIREIFEDLAMPYELLAELAEYCQQQGIDFMSTPFSKADFEAVDPYVQMHKIASYEISHLRLIELAAASGKPLLLSTGASRPDDIAWAVETFRRLGGGPLCLLQCTAKYPAPLESLNLRVIPWLSERFGAAAGLSDHSRHPFYAPLAAVSLGAQVIEKHFTLDNRLPGPDHAFAILPDELEQMVKAIRAAERMRGTGIKTLDPVEAELSTYARRGVQAIRAIDQGEALQEGQNIEILRPGKQRLGVHPRLLSELEGRPAKRQIALGDGIQVGDW